MAINLTFYDECWTEEDCNIIDRDVVKGGGGRIP